MGYGRMHGPTDISTYVPLTTLEKANASVSQLKKMSLVMYVNLFFYLNLSIRKIYVFFFFQSKLLIMRPPWTPKQKK